MDHFPRRSSHFSEPLRRTAPLSVAIPPGKTWIRHIQISFVSGKPIENSETVAAKSQSPSVASVMARPRME